MSASLLYGVVLAGGHSRRMQADKALLEYAGRTQLQRALHLLQAQVATCFVSVRADQREDSARAGHAQIVDLAPGLGPIGGIQAALHAYPEQAWLVLACDLPFLTAVTLEHLVARRDVPVDVAHIVTVLVFTQVRQVDAGAAEQRTVVALQQAVQPAQHRPLQAAQDRFRRSR